MSVEYWLSYEQQFVIHVPISSISDRIILNYMAFVRTYCTHEHCPLYYVLVHTLYNQSYWIMISYVSSRSALLMHSWWMRPLLQLWLLALFFCVLLGKTFYVLTLTNFWTVISSLCSVSGHVSKRVVCPIKFFSVYERQHSQACAMLQRAHTCCSFICVNKCSLLCKFWFSVLKLPQRGAESTQRSFWGHS